MYEIIWNFEIHMDHPIRTKRPVRVLINKEKRPCHLVDFPAPAN